MDTKLRLAFIGGGINSAVGNTHRIAARMDGRWDLVAGAFSRDQTTNTATARQWNVAPERTYAAWQDMLKAEAGQLDAIAILTPTNLHARMVTEALEQGYPVICEKALARSTTEGRQIAAALRQQRGFLAVTYNYTGYPMLRRLRQMIQAGDFGSVHQIQVEMPQEGFLKLDKDKQPIVPQKWRLTDHEIPTVSLDLGVHVHHLVRFLTGQTPTGVFATEDRCGHFPDVVDSVNAIVRYDQGMQGQMWYGKAFLGHRNGLRVRVYGQQGSAEWFQMQPEELRLWDAHGTPSILDRGAICEPAFEERYNRFKAGHPAGFIEAFANHYCDLADAICQFRQENETDNPWVFSIDDAIEGLELLEAMTIAARRRAWIELGRANTINITTNLTGRLSA